MGDDYDDDEHAQCTMYTTCVTCTTADFFKEEKLPFYWCFLRIIITIMFSSLHSPSPEKKITNKLALVVCKVAQQKVEKIVM